MIGMERKLLCQLFTATNCSTLAQHALKLICQTTFDSILFKSLLSHAGQLSCCDVTEVTWPKTGFSAADDADARSVVFFSFKSILLRTSEKCQSIKRTACMLNFIYIVQSKWYLRLKISVQGSFKGWWLADPHTHAGKDNTCQVREGPGLFISFPLRPTAEETTTALCSAVRQTLLDRYANEKLYPQHCRFLLGHFALIIVTSTLLCTI